jgi:inosine-uridine nucleoside N-ribohydrolase
MENKKISVWLDCDPGLDDTFAILLLGKHKGFNFIGLSTAAGNTSLDNTTKNALNVLYNIGRNDVPVIRGSEKLVFGKENYPGKIHGEGGLGGVKIP